jgi:hypothetical protein
MSITVHVNISSTAEWTTRGEYVVRNRRACPACAIISVYGVQAFVQHRGMGPGAGEAVTFTLADMALRHA